MKKFKGLIIMTLIAFLIGSTPMVQADSWPSWLCEQGHHNLSTSYYYIDCANCHCKSTGYSIGIERKREYCKSCSYDVTYPVDTYCPVCGSTRSIY